MRPNMSLILQKLAEQGVEPLGPGPKPPRKGQAWTTEEDDQLRHEFNQNKTLETIMMNHQRTASAMTSRMIRLGLVAAGPGGFYRIEQDPWITTAEANELQKVKRNASNT